MSRRCSGRIPFSYEMMFIMRGKSRGLSEKSPRIGRTRWVSLYLIALRCRVSLLVRIIAKWFQSPAEFQISTKPWVWQTSRLMSRDGRAGTLWSHAWLQIAFSCNGMLNAGSRSLLAALTSSPSKYYKSVPLPSRAADTNSLFSSDCASFANAELWAPAK